MRKFKVAIVERGKEALWRDYWITDGSKDGADAAPSELGRTEVVEATNVAEAIDTVQRSHRIAPLCLLAANITYRELRN